MGAAIVCGIIWGIAMSVVPLYLNLLLAPGIGYTVGELTSLSVNRKRGSGLAAVAGCCVVISYLVTIPFPSGTSFGLSSIPYFAIDLLALALGIFFAITRLR